MLTGIFSVLPSAVINDDQNPRTPTGRWVGDIVIENLNRISEMFRTLHSGKCYWRSLEKPMHNLP